MSVTNFKNPEEVGEGGVIISKNTKNLQDRLQEMEKVISDLRNSGMAEAPGLNEKIMAVENDIALLKSQDSLGMINSYGEVAVQRANAHIDYENQAK